MSGPEYEVPQDWPYFDVDQLVYPKGVSPRRVLDDLAVLYVDPSDAPWQVFRPGEPE